MKAKSEHSEYLKLMMDFVQESGQVALENIHDSKPSFKADSSVVTKTDKAISQLAQHKLDALLKNSDHILIDEESPDRNKYLNQDLLDQTKYVWSVDPIDGTRLYANRMPHFGISIGLMRDLKPWLGVVYFPMCHELFYCDGEKAYFVQKAFSDESKETKIKPVDEEISFQSILLSNEYFARRKDFVFEGAHVIIAECAIVDLCWPAIGRGCGATFKSSIWDMAGSWPIFTAAGLEMRSISTGKILDKLDVSHFDQNKIPWKVKDYYIVSSPRNYSIIKEKLGF